MNKETDNITYVRIEDVIPNRFQPRIAFDEEELNKLSESIKRYGIIQPLVVRPISDKYEIIAGERRYKASVIAGLKTIPVIIKETDDNTSAEIALLENIQRKNLTVIEEAKSYKKLLNRGFTQEDIAKKLGVSQSSIANKIRLLSLPEEVQDALLHNKISERHARSLLVLTDSAKQNEVLDKIINQRLTVKQTEDEINSILNKNDVDVINSFENKKDDKLETIDFKFPSIDDFQNNLDDLNNNVNTNTYKTMTATPFMQQPNKNIQSLDDFPEFNASDIINIEEKEKEPRVIVPESENINYNDLYETDDKIKTDNRKKYENINMEELITKIDVILKSYDLNKDNVRISEIDLLNKHQITIDIMKE